MSSLFKLSIKGIRSFEPENEETIQFGFPLTLICGQNGCGKTTIIECLKYVTTGDLPPNSKGGAFVNDPSISGRPVVTGQIKLAFRNANGKSMIATRTVQLTRKQTRGAFTNTFKTLEGQLATIDKGNKVSISTKNSELDAQTPIFLGASPAILDYVLFCHQDESLWPLSEASVLKKRFDDIFEASKFTKVLDNLKTIKKDMSTDIKLIEQSVKHLNIDKTRAKKIEDKVLQMNASVESYTEQIGDINLKIEAKEKEAEDLFASNQEFQKTLSTYESLKIQKRGVEEQIGRMKDNIDYIDEATDEELLSMVDSFNDKAKELEANLNELQVACESYADSMKEKQTELNDLIRLDGTLKAREDEYNQNMNKMASLISDNASDDSFQSSSYNSKEIARFKSALEVKNRQLEADLRLTSTLFKNSEADKQQLIQSLQDSITREEQLKEYSNNDIQSTKQKLSTFKKKIEISNSDESELKLKEEELQSTLAALDDKKKKNEVKTLDSKIEEKNELLSKLEFEVDELSKKITTSNKQSEIKTRLNMLKESLTTKTKYLEDVLTATKPSFKKAVGTDLDPQSCEAAFEDAAEKVRMEFETQQSKVAIISREADSTIALVKSINTSKEDIIQKISALKNEILAVIDESEIDLYESVVEDLEDSYRNVLEDVNTSEVTRQFNITAISIAEKEQHCLLCKRTFDSRGLQKFIDELQHSVKKEKIKETEDQAQEIKKELESVKSINSQVLSYRDSIKSSVEIIKRLDDLNATYEEQKFDLDAHEELLEESRNKKDEVLMLRKSLGEIVRLNGEILELQNQVKEVLEEIDGLGSVVLSISELQKLQQLKSLQIKSIRLEVTDDTEAKHDIQREIQRLENKVKDTRLAISNLEKSLADINNIKNSISELEEKILLLGTTLSNTKERLTELYENRDKLSSEFANTKETNRNVLDSKQKALNDSNEIVRVITQLSAAIKDYETHDINKLRENLSEQERVRKVMEALEDKMKAVRDEIKNLESQMMNFKDSKHHYIANLDYRAQLRKLEEIDNEIEALDIENAQARKEEYQERSRSLRQEITNLTSEHAGKIGEVKQIKDQVKGLQKELETDFKNVNEIYRAEWIKLQTNMFISNDIQTYSKALDNAIMKYHSIKMEDINRILGELWSQTYKGSDISTIAIKSDVNLQSKGNRSYNYRVVMYKNSNELDMRGRCSAGQKVLASILIRLALAECFGVNCGIIALDEPTTNLDHENSEALAEALNNIIEYRKAQRNFQLIVITHDENFLTHINGGKFTDHFYRVQRDEQQNSRIFRLPISKIQED